MGLPRGSPPEAWPRSTFDAAAAGCGGAPSGTVLAVPALRARVQGHVQRRDLGIVAKGMCTLEGAVFPRDLFGALGDGRARPIGDVIRQGGARIERPAAV